MHDIRLLTPPVCPYCHRAASAVERVYRVRRGDRVLPVRTWIWQCPGTCVDEATGASPFRFSDPPLGLVHDDTVRCAWRERFGEELPPSERGRRPSAKRVRRFQMLLSDSEWAEIDRRRGSETRAAYVRRALFGERRAG
jgi:glutaredoxin